MKTNKMNSKSNGKKRKALILGTLLGATILTATYFSNHYNSNSNPNASVNTTVENRLEPIVENNMNDDVHIQPEVESNHSNSNEKTPIVFPKLIKQDVIHSPVFKKSLDAEKGASLKLGKQGTIVHIQPNALLYEDGSPVSGLVDVEFKEYRDQADIVASNLPMTFEDQYFNSAGMFEIWANQGLKKLKIDPSKPVKVDFPVSDIPNTNYYALNQENNKWEFIEPLDNRKVNRNFENKIEVANFEIGEGFVKKDLTLRNVSPKEMLESFDYVQSKLENDNFKGFLLDHNFARSIDQTFDDFRYVSTKFIKDTNEINEKLFVRFYKVPGKYKKNKLFKIKFPGRYYPELRSFYGSSFVLDIPENEALDIKCTDIRLGSKDNETYTADLKFLDGSHKEIMMTPIQDAGFRKVSPEKNIKMITRYQKSLARKAKSFVSVAKYGTQEWRIQENKKVDQFYKCALVWMDTNDFKMKRKDWLNTFVERKKEFANKIEKLESEMHNLPAAQRNNWIANKMQEKNNWINTVSDIKTLQLQNKIVPQWGWQIVDTGDRTAGTLLAEGADAGHTYPKIVKGLNVSSFGVYNCDQAFRLSEPVTLNPTYKDQNGRYISNGSVAVVLDLDYNGSFSFNPESFTCSAVGRNHVLLFTKDKRVYHINDSQMDELNLESGNGSYTLNMSEVTDRVKTTNDLKKLIGLEDES
ncbi:MAG: hypothetical protein MRY83_20585 [Flavobacteriales bacterium]|nr:hypothetical protein [Flavobacteriales bacterium]